MMVNKLTFHSHSLQLSGEVDEEQVVCPKTQR